MWYFVVEEILGLFQNLSSAPEVLHISYHPSRPYASCILSQHNKSGNDDRTNYYGIYGATPRIVVQGNVQSAGVNFTSASIYTSEQGNTTPVQLKLTTLKQGMDSLVVKVTVAASDTHSLQNLNLYVVAVEDTIFYNAPNGENEHKNVYRKTLIDQSISLPSMVGDSIVFYARTANDMAWDASRMFAMAFVQNSSTKFIEQVESSNGDKGATTASVSDIELDRLVIYPNPVTNTLNIRNSNAELKQLEIVDTRGVTVFSQELSGQTNFDVSNLQSGLYFLKVKSDDVETNSRFIKN